MPNNEPQSETKKHRLPIGGIVGGLAATAALLTPNPVHDFVYSRPAGVEASSNPNDPALCPEAMADLYAETSMANLEQSVAETDFFFNDPAELADIAQSIDAAADQPTIEQIAKEVFAKRGIKLHLFDPAGDGITSNEAPLDLPQLKSALNKFIESYANLPASSVKSGEIFLVNGIVLGGKHRGGEATYPDKKIFYDVNQFTVTASSWPVNLVGHEEYHLNDFTSCEGHFAGPTQDPKFNALHQDSKSLSDDPSGDTYSETHSVEDKAVIAGNLISGQLNPHEKARESDVLKLKYELISNRLNAISPGYTNVIKYRSLFPADITTPPKVLLAEHASPVDGYLDADTAKLGGQRATQDFQMPDGSIERLTALQSSDKQITALRLRQVGSLQTKDLTQIAADVFRRQYGDKFKLANVRTDIDPDGYVVVSYVAESIAS